MNKTEAIEMLTTSVAAWNEYRNQNVNWRPDLQHADLANVDLQGADLRYADLSGANLRGTNLGGVYLRGADLAGAYLQSARMTRSQVQPWIGEPDWQDET